MDKEHLAIARLQDAARLTSMKHEAYMTKKEFQEERICPFCGGKLHMREFEIMDRW